MDLARLDGVHRSTFGSTNSNTGGEMDEPRSSRLVAVSSLHVEESWSRRSLGGFWFWSGRAHFI